MRTLEFIALGALLGALGCSKGDGLVVVTVDATAPLEQIAMLHATSMAGGRSTDHDLGADSPPFSLPPAKTFAVQVPSSIEGSFFLRVEARDASGRVLAAGTGMTTLSRSGRRDMEIRLEPAALSPSSPTAVWISSGGGTAGADTELGLSIGGVTAPGTSAAEGGAQITSGFFSSGTY